MRGGIPGAAAILLLAGCMAPGTEEAGGYVRLVSGNSFIGQTVITIHESDRVTREDTEPHAAAPRVTRMAAVPGRHAEARALAEAAFPAILAAQADPEGQAVFCPTDIGPDAVLVSPPVAGVDGVHASCGPDGVLELMGRIGALAR